MPWTRRGTWSGAEVIELEVIEPAAPPEPEVPPSRNRFRVAQPAPAPRDTARHAKPDPAPEPQAALESDQQRLLRLVRSIARQEPGLCWAAGPARTEHRSW